MFQFHRHSAVRGGLCAAAAIVSILAPPAQPAPDRVARSNAHTRVVLETQARVAPEGAAQVGVSGVDDQITDLAFVATANCIRSNRELHS